ncbi:MAG: hypothetical protein QOI67_1731 [Gaiellaceae bacterium]|jgi:UDP-N-acetylglucosamine 2-epimerase (non-hydrolysing)|nr:hypothetical protein [Gaiellaceae bacterium]
MNQSPPSVVFVVGARPNFMKAAPVIAGLREVRPDASITLVHTGQHYDDEMSAVFLDELKLPPVNAFLGIGSGTHAEQTARALVGVEGVLIDRRPQLVVVAGDVNSTLAAALAAAKLDQPVAHIESGLRSFDETMPEEHNRRLTDHLSTLLFAHSPDALENLAAEGIAADRVHLVGNTMIDTLLGNVARARAAEPWLELGLGPGEYGLVTLHRPALVDDDLLLAAVSTALAELGSSFPLVFPAHPRTVAALRRLGLERRLEGGSVLLTGPLSYVAFLGLEAEARFVLTDSGGVQEETTALGVRCFTLRDSTERPITVEQGTNLLLGADPDRIADIPTLLETPVSTEPIPLWDGSAGLRAARVIAGFLAAAR